MDSGTAATEQAARQAEQSFSSAAEGMREINSKLLGIAQTNTMAGLNLAGRINAHKSTDRVIGSLVKARSKPSPKII